MSSGFFLLRFLRRVFVRNLDNHFGSILIVLKHDERDSLNMAIKIK